MFTSQLSIYGKGAELLKKYSKDKQGTPITFTVSNGIGEKKDIYLFDTYIQGYMVCALLGILNKKKVIEDTSGKESDAKIFTDILLKNKRNLDDIVALMILSEEGSSADKKIRKAFSVQREKDVDDQLERDVTAYAKGGLYIIDQMFGNCRTYEEVANQILNLKKDLQIEF